MEMELEQEDEHVKIESLSPYQVKQLLLSILVQRSDEYDLRTPLQRRQLDGALSRVPKDFYERVWEILERTPGGIKVAGYLLPQVANTMILFVMFLISIIQSRFLEYLVLFLVKNVELSIKKVFNSIWMIVCHA